MALPHRASQDLTPSQVAVRGRIADFGAVAAWCCLVSILVVAVQIDDPDAIDGPVATIAATMFWTSAILWIAMWVEFFREKPSSNSLFWGFLLMTGPVIGPLLFYHRIWRRRHDGKRA